MDTTTAPPNLRQTLIDLTIAEVYRRCTPNPYFSALSEDLQRRGHEETEALIAVAAEALLDLLGAQPEPK